MSLLGWLDYPADEKTKGGLGFGSSHPFFWLFCRNSGGHEGVSL